MGNSNGTLVSALEEENKKDVEKVEPGIYEALKKDKDSHFVRYLRAADIVFLKQEKYNPRLINGAETLPEIIDDHPFGLFAGASEAYLRKAYGGTPLENFITYYFSVLSNELRKERDYAPKNVDTFAQLKELLRSEGLNPIGYISHKLKEAVLGAEVFGKGILINPDKKSVDDSRIVVVDSLDSTLAKQTIQRLYQS